MSALGYLDPLTMVRRAGTAAGGIDIAGLACLPPIDQEAVVGSLPDGALDEIDAQLAGLAGLAGLGCASCGGACGGGGIEGLAGRVGQERSRRAYRVQPWRAGTVGFQYSQEPEPGTAPANPHAGGIDAMGNPLPFQTAAPAGMAGLGELGYCNTRPDLVPAGREQDIRQLTCCADTLASPERYSPGEVSYCKGFVPGSGAYIDWMPPAPYDRPDLADGPRTGQMKIWCNDPKSSYKSFGKPPEFNARFGTFCNQWNGAGSPSIKAWIAQHNAHDNTPPAPTPPPAPPPPPFTPPPPPPPPPGPRPPAGPQPPPGWTPPPAPPTPPPAPIVTVTPPTAPPPPPILPTIPTGQIVATTAPLPPPYNASPIPVQVQPVYPSYYGPDFDQGGEDFGTIPGFANPFAPTAAAGDFADPDDYYAGNDGAGFDPVYTGGSGGGDPGLAPGDTTAPTDGDGYAGDDPGGFGYYDAASSGFRGLGGRAPGLRGHPHDLAGHPPGMRGLGWALTRPRPRSPWPADGSGSSDLMGLAGLDITGLVNAAASAAGQFLAGAGTSVGHGDAGPGIGAAPSPFSIVGQLFNASAIHLPSFIPWLQPNAPSAQPKDILSVGAGLLVNMFPSISTVINRYLGTNAVSAPGATDQGPIPGLKDIKTIAAGLLGANFPNLSEQILAAFGLTPTSAPDPVQAKYGIGATQHANRVDFPNGDWLEIGAGAVGTDGTRGDVYHVNGPTWRANPYPSAAAALAAFKSMSPDQIAGAYGPGAKRANDNTVTLPNGQIIIIAGLRGVDVGDPTTAVYDVYANGFSPDIGLAPLYRANETPPPPPASPPGGVQYIQTMQQLHPGGVVDPKALVGPSGPSSPGPKIPSGPSRIDPATGRSSGPGGAGAGIKSLLSGSGGGLVLVGLAALALLASKRR